MFNERSGSDFKAICGVFAPQYDKYHYFLKIIVLAGLYFCLKAISSFCKPVKIYQMKRPILNFVLYFLMFSFIGLFFSAFSFENELTAPIQVFSIEEFFYENWAIIGLFLSEIAALLPGKPKGILHAIITFLTRYVEKNPRITKRV